LATKGRSDQSPYSKETLKFTTEGLHRMQTVWLRIDGVSQVRDEEQ